MLEAGFEKICDVELVNKGFIFGEGFTRDYRFLEKSYLDNPFGEDVCVPIMHFLKVHMGHPIRITSLGDDSLVYPEEELRKKNPRSELEIYEDKDAYDLATFMVVPYNVSESNREQLPIYEGSSLLYLEHGSSMEPEDLRTVSHIMPSQVLPHFQRWLGCNNFFFIKDENGKSRKKGFVMVDNQNNFSSALLKSIGKLEKRFDL
jgi:hypothetical protein